jgi:hypothetical protein
MYSSRSIAHPPLNPANIRTTIDPSRPNSTHQPFSRHPIFPPPLDSRLTSRVHHCISDTQQDLNVTPKHSRNLENKVLRELHSQRWAELQVFLQAIQPQSPRVHARYTADRAILVTPVRITGWTVHVSLGKVSSSSHRSRNGSRSREYRYVMLYVRGQCQREGLCQMFGSGRDG